MLNKTFILKKISIIKCLIGLGVLLLVLAACSTYAFKSATFRVETGDNVQVRVDTKAGYDLTMEVPFVISKDEETILTGGFGKLEAYELYYQLVADDINAELLAEDSKDGNDYFFYTVNGKAGIEYDYVLRVGDGQTVVIIASLASRAEAEAAFAGTKISLAEEE